MRREKGFTLIELMIVIAIIAIIAAIAIPGLLSSQRAANERNASASLKTVATAQIDFRSNDRDTNRVNDFWTASVAGLYILQPGNADASVWSAGIKLIDPSIASADVQTNAELDDDDNAVANNWSYRCVAVAATGQAPIMPSRGAKAGYWYYALISDLAETTAGETYLVATDGTAALHHHGSKFGVGALPDSYGVGRSLFMINESATIIRLPLVTGYVRPQPTAYPPARFTTFSNAGTQSIDVANFPRDTDMPKFSKMD